MLDDLTTNRRLWLATATLALLAATLGLLQPGIYARVVTDRILPGVVAQDAFTFVLAVAALALAWRVGEGESRLQALLLGLMGYLFYAYGVYAIEQLYTVAYFAYLAVFGLAAYAIVYALVSLRRSKLDGASLPRYTRIVSLVGLVGTPAVFVPLWASQLLPLIRSGERLEYLYAVYVLDLSFVMPAFLVVALLTYRRDVLGYALAPAMFVVGFAVLAPLAVGELLRPTLVGQQMDTGSFGLFLALSAGYLALAALTFRALGRAPGGRVGGPTAGPPE